MDINKIPYEQLPDYMQGGMQRWIEHGLAPGGFLSAVICNDLKNACAQADDFNKDRLCLYVRWLYNEAPTGCWGSRKAFDEWKGTKHDERFKLLQPTLKSV